MTNHSVVDKLHKGRPPCHLPHICLRDRNRTRNHSFRRTRIRCFVAPYCLLPEHFATPETARNIASRCLSRPGARLQLET